MDGYVTWREESAAAAASYRNWRCASRHERGLAFDAHISDSPILADDVVEKTFLTASITYYYVM